MPMLAQTTVYNMLMNKHALQIAFFFNFTEKWIKISINKEVKK